MKLLGFSIVFFLAGRRDRSFEAELGLDSPGVRFSIGEIDFSLFCSVQIGSGATRPSVEWVRGDLSLGVRRYRRGADNSSPFSADFRNV